MPPPRRRCRRPRPGRGRSSMPPDGRARRFGPDRGDHAPPDSRHSVRQVQQQNTVKEPSDPYRRRGRANERSGTRGRPVAPVPCGEARHLPPVPRSTATQPRHYPDGQHTRMRRGRVSPSAWLAGAFGGTTWGRHSRSVTAIPAYGCWSTAPTGTTSSRSDGRPTPTPSTSSGKALTHAWSRCRERSRSRRRTERRAYGPTAFARARVAASHRFTDPHVCGADLHAAIRLCGLISRTQEGVEQTEAPADSRPQTDGPGQRSGEVLVRQRRPRVQLARRSCG
ncbi:hypothetical protein BX265_7136 [Streptomyces sp. TLI_235]|nr:hypothetical protein BX265_7136 [Streptomyces sp. TLI_235]